MSNGFITYLNWTPTALYLASSDEMPKPVQKKLEKMESADLIRRCDVQRLIDAAKPKPEPEPEMEPYRENEEQPELSFNESPPDRDQVEDDPAPVDVPAKPEPPTRTSTEQAKLNRQLAQSLIDKAVRAVLHEIQ